MLRNMLCRPVGVTPFWWTVDGLGFKPPPGEPLRGRWGALTQASVTPVRMVPSLDELEHRLLGLAVGGEVRALKPLALHVAKKLSAMAWSWQSSTEPIKGSRPQCRPRSANAKPVY